MKTATYKTARTAVIFLFVLFLFGSSAQAQNGAIKMEVFDETNTAAVEAIVSLMSGDEIVTKTKPDFNGDCSFKEVVPGTYDIKTVMNGHKDHIQKGVQVSANKTSYVKIVLELKSNDLKIDVTIVPDKKSVVSELNGTGTTIDFVTLNHMAVDKGNITAVMLNTSSELQPTPDGKGVYSRGARELNTEYIIDGEKVIGSFSVPALSIQGMTVYTGGVPASYGDFTGGLVMITTKSFFNGVTAKKNMYDEISQNKMEEEQWQKEQKEKNKQEKK